MGDYCSMSITCRRQDAHLFEELGFMITFDTGGVVVNMEDMEANYGHDGSLPSHVPWLGNNGAGSAYGPSAHACDGKTHQEWGTDSDGSYLVAWCDHLNKPHPKEVASVRQFIKLEKRVQKIFERFKKTEMKAEVRRAILAAETRRD